jgi:hypothetical protein
MSICDRGGCVRPVGSGKRVSVVGLAVCLVYNGIESTERTCWRQLLEVREDVLSESQFMLHDGQTKNTRVTITFASLCTAMLASPFG